MSRRALLSTTGLPKNLVANTPLLRTTSIARTQVIASTVFKQTNLFRANYTTQTSATKMRAVLIKDGKGPAENLYLGEEGTPEPKKGEVQVKVGHFFHFHFLCD